MHQYRLRERLEHGTPGRPWHLYRLGSVRGAVFPCHWHPEWELLVVRRGTLDLVRNQTSFRLGPGDAVLLAGTELHGATGDPGVEVAALVFQPAVLRSEHRDEATDRWIAPLEAGLLQVSAVVPSGSPAAGLALQLVGTLEANRPGADLAVKGLLLQIIAELAAGGFVVPGDEPTSGDPLPRIRASLQWIEERWADPLKVEALAAQAHLSPSQFARLFKAVTGDTPLQHVLQRRMVEAERLLRDGSLSVTEVALRVGFTNFGHFSRTFRAHWGLSPSEFKKDWASRTRTPPPMEVRSRAQPARTRG